MLILRGLLVFVALVVSAMLWGERGVWTLFATVALSALTWSMWRERRRLRWQNDRYDRVEAIAVRAER